MKKFCENIPILTQLFMGKASHLWDGILDEISKVNTD